MQAVFERAYAKVNIALHVLGRRKDGYHELDSVVVFSDVADHIEITEAQSLSLTITGPFGKLLPNDAGNMVLKAHAALAALYKTHNLHLPNVHIALEKNLPVASGIGGGSANAAAVLRGLLKLFPSTLPAAEIAACALSLGADVPVCFSHKTCRMQGVGDRLTFPKLILPPAILLINPNVPVSTPDVFSALNLAREQNHLAPLEMTNPQSWRNDLTAAAVQCEPAIQIVLNKLKSHHGAVTTGMSGSGATCFGLCENIGIANAIAAEIFNAHPQWWVRAGNLI